MISTSFSALLAGLVTARYASATSVSDFVTQEQAIALQGVFNNIGANGSLAPGAASGLVIASPSTANPNYYYTWTRDSALTLRMLVDELIFGNSSVQSTIDDYVSAQALLQTVSNPSGSFLPSGLGLGEPKFNVNGTRFDGAWGRPQRDGPALRAIALIEYSNWLLAKGQKDKVSKTLWPIISNDISYVGQYWNSTGFDLWEEVSGSSFFTTQNHYKSLVVASQLAAKIGQNCTSCAEAANALCFLQTYWNGKYFTANINLNNNKQRSGIDANTMLGAISVFDVAASCTHPSLQPCHSRSLASFKVFVDAFRNATLYPINANIAASKGVALGRYPEDIYYNGNPWYLITQGAAEFLYDAVAQWKHQGSISVDSTSLAFFKDLYPSAKAGDKYTQSKTSHKKERSMSQVSARAASDTFQTVVTAATTYADSFVAVAQKYTPSNGSLSEQFHKVSGKPLSAYDLTWSFASFVTMARRRAGHYPAYSWANETVNVPAVCTASSTKGVYAAAGAGSGGCTSSVLFVVNATTYYGENIYLVGNTTDLGAWDLASAQPLSANNYTSTRPEWFVEVQMTGGEYVKYAYVREENCGQASIYETVNRTLHVPACDSSSASSTSAQLATNDKWTGSVGSSGSC
ncbi:hypothetical protein SEPCBS57363_002269 [Sporothrix epigloea]|uniref:Glucoamylase n=1 Tax=Sporothrix epigloea TaxID=1892477 RepID=A0ABP0DGL8_9PEZI